MGKQGEGNHVGFGSTLPLLGVGCRAKSIYGRASRATLSYFVLLGSVQTEFTAAPQHRSGTGRFYATPSSSISLYISGTGRFYATPSAVSLYKSGTGRFSVFFWKLVQLYLSIKWNRKVSLPAVLLGAESLFISVKGSFMFQLFFLEVRSAVPQCRCGTDIFYLFFLDASTATTQHRTRYQKILCSSCYFYILSVAQL